MVLLPRKVEEVVIAVPNTLYDSVVSELSSHGLLHIDEPPRIKEAKASPRYRILYNKISEKHAKIESYYTVLGVEPEKVSGVELEAGSWEEAFENAVREYKDLEDEYDRGVARIAEIESRIAELEAVKAMLEYAKHLDAPVRDAQNASMIGYALGILTLEKGEDPDSIVRTATSKGLLVAVEEVGEERKLLVALAGPRRRLHELLQELRGKWTPIAIPEDLPGSPKKAYAAAQSEIAGLAREEEDIVARLKSRLQDLNKYYTLISALKYAGKLLASTVKTRTMSFFRGYIDVKDKRKLEESLTRASRGAYLLASLGVKRASEESGKKPPTKVDLPRILRPFHEIVRMYGEPDPDEIVPTLFLALSLPVIFGLMFPDAGHGLLVLLFALYFVRKGSPWRFLLSVLAIASIVTGILAGELFGPIVSAKIGLYSFWQHLGFKVPPLAQPTITVEEEFKHIVSSRTLLFRMISISLWIGAYMLTLGTLLGAVDAWLKGEKDRMIASKIPMFIFFLSATLPFLVVPDAGRAGGIIKQGLLETGHGGVLQAIVFYGVLIGIIWMLLGEPIIAAKEGHSPLKALVLNRKTAYEMFLMVLGNIPSFLRILGLALAHAGLMLGFAELYYLMAGHGIVGLISAILTYIFGNLLVAGLEAIIAFAHSLRLHFYEWFSKFYSGTGIPFQPLRLEGVRIRIRPL